MLDKLKKTISDAVKEQATNVSDAIKEQAGNMSEAIKEKTGNVTDAIKEQATNVTDAFKEKTYNLIEDWLKIFPNLESHGLKINSFGLSVGISPSLDVELRGKANTFTIGKLELLIEENKGNQPLTTVFKAIKMTYEMHKRTGTKGDFNAILIQLSVKITPEVKVYLGTPLLT
jgi:hypothetical protein